MSPKGRAQYTTGSRVWSVSPKGCSELRHNSLIRTIGRDTKSKSPISDMRAKPNTLPDSISLEHNGRRLMTSTMRVVKKYPSGLLGWFACISAMR